MVFEVLESFKVDVRGLFHPVVLVRLELFSSQEVSMNDKGGVLIFSEYIRTPRKVKYHQFNSISKSI